MTGRPIPGHHWLQIDLSHPNYICGVVLDWEDAYSDHWNIVGRSDDQHSWTPIFERKDATNSTHIERLSFPFG